MKANLIQIKPWDETISRSVLIEIYNKMIRYLNPKYGVELNKDLLNSRIGKVSLLTNFLRFENGKGRIIAFTGIVKHITLKDVWIVYYGLLPRYFKSDLLKKIVDASLDLGKELDVPELFFNTTSSLSTPIDVRLKTLGFKPIISSWKMQLDDLTLFKIPKIPQGIKIQKHNEISDFNSYANVINQAFQNSPKFNPKTGEKYEQIYNLSRKYYDIEHCFAYENNLLIGTCNLFINPKKRSIGLLGDLGVLPSYQHRGIGNALFGFGVDSLRKKGCTEINLDVEAENENALSLYKKYSFYILEDLTKKTYQII
ncbi:MAG: GNAT family N-acetyltransferase [Promethearchaeota archaeon]|jgi:GNAT superfamily N-acetyltransferase